MDPICHTLVGAALGEAGLKRRTPLAVPTLLIGANLPDIDVASYYWSPVAALAFRRGWSHGALALLVLPLLLTAIMLLCDTVAARLRPGHPRADAAGVLLLSAVSVATHPLLDLLNTYGVRLLLPLQPRWFYGDTLFIVDFWVWLALAVGIVASRRREQRDGGRETGTGFRAVVPARMALLVVIAYVIVMGGMGRAGRWLLAAELRELGVPARRMMVAPVPVRPLRRDIVAETADAYRFGSMSLVPPRVSLAPSPRAKHDRHPAALAAARSRDGRRFLVWSRFPYYLIDSTLADEYQVRIMDARYNAEWASVTVRVPRR